MLRVSGTNIVDENGNPLTLRGYGLGGWMNMENFITGFPGNEESWRTALRHELGEEKYRFLFDRFLEYFFGDEDAAHLKSLGLNVLRLPINYRHFESDMQPFTIQEEGFRHLDRVIDICARHQIYTIVDLHAVQGYQNQDWHSDNPTHVSFLWRNKHFQDRAVHLWEAIADRYQGNRWVAGYNLINEPNEPDLDRFRAVHRRLFDAVRAVDPEHIIFLDGNGYGSNCAAFGEPWPNTVYDAHDYAYCGFSFGGPYPGYTRDVYCDRAWLEKHFHRKTAFMQEHDVPSWIGEFGPIFTGDPEIDESRYRLVKDQIEMYDSYGASWSLWTYKDIGLMGLVYAAPDSPYMERLRPSLTKKQRMSTDTWSTTGADIHHVMEPIERLFQKEFPEGPEMPMGAEWTTERLVRAILFSESLLPEFARHFRHLSENDIDVMMHSFAFDRCIQRDPLARILESSAGQ